MRQTGWQSIGGKEYYLIDNRYISYSTSNEGRMVTGFKTISGNRFYFYSDGSQQTQWGAKNINGSFYFFGDGHVIRTKTGWFRDGSDYYYVNTTSGKLKTGWLSLSDGTYYLSKGNAKMFKGPNKVDGTLYFFDTSGRRATTEGWKSYNGNKYYSYSNGTLAHDTVINGYRIGSDGRAVPMDGMDAKAYDTTSRTNYLIVIDRTNCQLGVYTGSVRNWTRRNRWSCSVGKSSTPTYTGSYEISSKQTYFDSGYARCWYASKFNGNQLIHSQLYDQTDQPTHIMDADGGLGQHSTDGCVRLYIDNARWIYNNVPSNTRVVVY